MTRKSQPLVRQEAQMETEVLDEVVLKDQNPDLEPCVVGCPEPGLLWSLSGTGELLLSPFR